MNPKLPVLARTPKRAVALRRLMTRTFTQFNTGL
jgi:hypothetical protein